MTSKPCASPSAASNGTVLIERDGAVAIVRLHRPEQMNAVNRDIRAGLTAALAELDRDADVGAIVLAGSGPRAFCAGQDLHEAAAMDFEHIVDFIEAQHAMYRAVRAVNKPVVAAIHGVAAGAGFQVALCADLRVAAAKARLGQPEVKAGMASIVGTYLMTLHLGLGHNVELSLTGELISGQRAYEIGLVHQIVEDDQPEAVLAAAMARARALAALPAVPLRVSKQRLRALTQPDFDEACVAGIRYQLECYSHGTPQAAIAAFFKERAARAAGR